LSALPWRSRHSTPEAAIRQGFTPDFTKTVKPRPRSRHVPNSTCSKVTASKAGTRCPQAENCAAAGIKTCSPIGQECPAIRLRFSSRNSEPRQFIPAILRACSGNPAINGIQATGVSRWHEICNFGGKTHNCIESPPARHYLPLRDTLPTVTPRFFPARRPSSPGIPLKCPLPIRPARALR
jgi:hypothetical protein